MLGELVPEGGFAGGEECVFAGVPTEKMRSASVSGMVLASSPDFMEKESTGLVGATMKIEPQAALFLARGREESAEFGFEKDLLAFLGAKRDDEGDCIFRKFRDRGAAGSAPGGPPGGFAGFPFGHVGGDCTPNRSNGKENRGTPLVHLKVDAMFGCRPKPTATFGRRPCGRRSGCRS
jgi:hypothetical protein